ncbi:VOC family protein [Egicoccus sp. AB-alg2]|uniref:VOC family protein n=1 Tax=Egicoccus sp. AB-alg2 TaxID=3242693 RepID=UPI00359E3245
MAARVSHTTINCLDAYEVSEWWKRLLDYTDVPGDPNLPGDPECMIVDPRTGHRLLFIEVAELQDPVGRVHLDLAPTDLTRDEEIERVLALGARMVADRRRPDGSGWAVLEDPAGNRFCIVRSDAERAARSPATPPERSKSAS